jgi:non-reducing end alpha-L-arabinofuranosidase
MTSRKFGSMVARSTLGAGFIGACAFAGCSEPTDPAPGTGGSNTSGSAGTGSGKGGSAGTSPGGSAGTGTAGTSAGTSPAGGKGGSVGGSAGTTGGSSAGTGTSGQGGAGGASAGSAGTSAGGASAGTSPGGSGGSAGSGQAGSGTAGSAGSGTAGTGGSSGVGERPCDIYADADTPCVGAFSTTRSLYSTYTGPLYQLRKGGPDPNTGSGGMTMDIGLTGNGFADSAAHEAFCGSDTCTFAIIYDQSGRENNLTVGKAGCYEGTAGEDDYESNAVRRPLTVGGNEVYALYMDKHEGYRNNETDGMPTGTEAQGIYMVAEGSGKRQGAGCCCCWNFGNASTDNCYGPSGQMNALYLGVGYWGKGTGSGPWFMGDFEAGVWAGGTGASNATNNMLPSMTMDYAFGILKTNASNYAIRVGDAQTGNLTTAYDGGIPTAFNGRWTMQGAIILGIGGDNSNSSDGTFLEGAITAGRPTDETDAAVHANVKAAGYGM